MNNPACYAVVWQHVIGMVCVLCASVECGRTQHSELYTHHSHDMLPHHRVAYGLFFHLILI